MPAWLPNIPQPAKVDLPATARTGAAAVYFSACVNRIFGNSDASAKLPSLAQAMVAVSARAGLPLWIPDDLAGNGDRGFLHPELTHSATEEQVEELKGRHVDRYVSSNRTCEIGMNLATGKDYRSVIFLREELTRTES
jgi:hypothetical protein